MSRVKIKTLRELNDSDLLSKLSERKLDLSRLRSEEAKGTLKKHAGSIKWIRRDIARLMTIISERK